MNIVSIRVTSAFGAPNAPVSSNVFWDREEVPKGRHVVSFPGKTRKSSIFLCRKGKQPEVRLIWSIITAREDLKGVLSLYDKVRGLNWSPSGRGTLGHNRAVERRGFACSLPPVITPADDFFSDIWVPNLPTMRNERILWCATSPPWSCQAIQTQWNQLKDQVPSIRHSVGKDQFRRTFSLKVC